MLKRDDRKLFVCNAVNLSYLLLQAVTDAGGLGKTYSKKITGK